MNIFELDAHQLDVIRTLFTGVGATGGLFGGLAALFSYLNRRGIKQVVANTQHSEWKDGRMRGISVAELSHRNLHTTEEVRGEVTHLANEQTPRVHGRRRLDTGSIPGTVRLPPDESEYQ